MTYYPKETPLERYFVEKLTEEEIIDYVKGLFDCSVGILQAHKISDRFNIMAWGMFDNMLQTYDINQRDVNVLYFYDRINKIKIIRKEDMTEILDRYHSTKAIIDETKPEDPEE